MAVSTQESEIQYVGTEVEGGSAGPFDITFPFFKASDIFAAIAPESGEEAVLLSPSDYTVTRFDSGLGELLLDEPISFPQVLVIFREVPLTQPTIFAETGPFLAKANETALDRLLMQVQQLSRRISLLSGEGGGSGGFGSGILIWEAPEDRATASPRYVGQLAVETQTQTVWIAQSVEAGDWKVFLARKANTLILGLVSDAALPGAHQTAVADLFTDWACDAVLFAGNGHTGVEGQYHGNWAAFASLITDGKAYPALGPQDLDDDGWEARHVAKFPYLADQHGGRYYTVTLGDGLLDIFVLHSGFNSIRVLEEDDGNEVGSVQHAWFVSALAASTARWKIAVFSQPPLSMNAGNVVAGEMAWPELAQMDLICCGNAHLLEIFRWQETMLVNLSASAYDDGTNSGTIQGEPSATDRLLWVNATSRGLGRLVVSGDRLELEVRNLSGQLIHARTALDFNASDGTAQDVIWDAAGDLIYGTGENSAERLALGTAGQALKVNAGATAPQWGTLGYAGGGTNASTQAEAVTNMQGAKLFDNAAAITAATPTLARQLAIGSDGSLAVGVTASSGGYVVGGVTLLNPYLILQELRIGSSSGVAVFSSGVMSVDSTPALGTPSSVTLTHATGLPLTTGVTGTLPVANGGTGLTALGTGVATALGVNVGSAGAFLTFNGNAGTPSAVTLTNGTGLPVAGITGFGTGVATALAVNTGSSGAFVVLGGAAGTPSSITLTNGTGLPIAGLTASTSAALGVGSLELGHATDTTLARVSAGVVSIEGVNIATISATQTLTNKTIAHSANTITGDDTAYDATSWNGSSAVPTKNAVRDKIESMNVVSRTATSSFTLALSDVNNYIRLNHNSTTITVTVPTNASVAFPIDSEIAFFRVAGAVCTFSAAGGVTINSSGDLRDIASKSGVVLRKIGANEWDLIGGLE